MTTDHNEAMRLADLFELEPDLDSLYRQAAALIRKQAERIAELERLSTGLSTVYNEAMDSLRIVVDERDTLRAEVERLRVDAERMDWLRSAHWSDAPLCCVLEPKANVRLGATCPSGDQLDTAIDTARKATQ